MLYRLLVTYITISSKTLIAATLAHRRTFAIVDCWQN